MESKISRFSTWTNEWRVVLFIKKQKHERKSASIIEDIKSFYALNLRCLLCIQEQMLKRWWIT